MTTASPAVLNKDRLPSFVPSASDNPAPMVSWYNREARILDVGDKSYKASKYRAIIMDCLLKVPGAIVKSDQIIYELWAARGLEEPDGAAEVLRVQIHHIRKKTGAVIHSVWGKGYCLGQPDADLEINRLYEGKGDVGRWRVMKSYREPVYLLVSEDGKEEHWLPQSSARFWGLKPVSE